MKVVLNPTVEEFKGKIGGMVYKKHRGKQIACKCPGAREASEELTAVQERFKTAASYAKHAVKDEILGPAYQLAGELKDKPAYALALGDYCKPPVVKAIDISKYHGYVGDPIVILAIDNFGVVGVDIKIEGPSDLELGTAVESPIGSGRWEYRAQNPLSKQTLQITATAKDRPGGEGLMTASVVLP